MSTLSLRLSALLLTIITGCQTESSTKRLRKPALIGVYHFQDRLQGQERAPEFLVVNSDGTFFQFHGSLVRHRADCHTGSWDYAEGSDHIQLNSLRRWDEDTEGLGGPLSDSVISFLAPIETDGKHISLVLNSDLGRKFTKE